MPEPKTLTHKGVEYNLVAFALRIHLTAAISEGELVAHKGVSGWEVLYRPVADDILVNYRLAVPKASPKEKTVYTPGEWVPADENVNPKGDYAVMWDNKKVKYCRAYRDHFGDLCRAGITHVCVRVVYWETPALPEPPWRHRPTNHSGMFYLDPNGDLMYHRHEREDLTYRIQGSGGAYIKEALDAKLREPGLLAKLAKVRTLREKWERHAGCSPNYKAFAAELQSVLDEQK